MLFEEEGTQSLDDLTEAIEVAEENCYIADSKKAVELIALLVHNQKQERNISGAHLKRKMHKVFRLMSQCNITDTFEQQRKFEILCDRLSESSTVDVLRGKKIVSLGGRFSSGKSKFINAITGMEDELPVDQNPTTSVPTYIVHGTTNEIEVSTSFGYSCKLSKEAMGALSHEFYNKYGIGFSAFLENIIVKTARYGIPDNIALLDTPGYSKADTDSSVRERTADKQKAFDKLSITDHLIWLIDIENGTITTEDLNFINSLKLQSKILFVFTKADKFTEDAIKQVLELANRTISEAGIPCYAITAYSAVSKKEYFGDYINQFFREISEDSASNNDVYAQLMEFEDAVANLLLKEKEVSKKREKEYFAELSRAEHITAIHSIVRLWKTEKQRISEIRSVLKLFHETCNEINSTNNPYEEDADENWIAEKEKLTKEYMQQIELMKQFYHSIKIQQKDTISSRQATEKYVEELSMEVAKWAMKEQDKAKARQKMMDSEEYEKELVKQILQLSSERANLVGHVDNVSKKTRNGEKTIIRIAGQKLSEMMEAYFENNIYISGESVCIAKDITLSLTENMQPPNIKIIIRRECRSFIKSLAALKMKSAGGELKPFFEWLAEEILGESEIEQQHNAFLFWPQDKNAKTSSIALNVKERLRVTEEKLTEFFDTISDRICDSCERRLQKQTKRMDKIVTDKVKSTLKKIDDLEKEMFGEGIGVFSDV